MKNKLTLLVLCCCLTACAGLTAWYEKPDTKTAITKLTEGVSSYLSGNSIGAAIDGVQGAAALIRSLQSTPKAAQPTALQIATANGGAAPIASLVANAVVAQVRAGVPPDKANEQVASTLDKVVAAAGP